MVRWRNEPLVVQPHLLLLITLLLLTYFPIAKASNCEVRAPRSMGVEERRQLCKNSATLGEGPAYCAKSLKIVNIRSSRNSALAIDLCQDARDIGPSVCWSHLKKKYHNQIDAASQVRLCKSAADIEPAECANTIIPLYKQISSDQVVEFCQGFQDLDNTDSIEECFLSASKKLGPGNKLTLCRNNAATVVSLNATDVPPPVQCSNELISKSLKPNVVAQTCTGATSTAPAECFLALQSKKWADSQVIELCQQATSTASAECAMAIKSKKLKPDHRVRLCKSAPQFAAECANTVTSRLTSRTSTEEVVKTVLNLCTNNNSSSASAACFSTVLSSQRDVDLALALCKDARDSEPAKCFAAAKSRFTTAEALQLCQGASASTGTGTTTAAIKCITSLRSVRVPTEVATSLCNRASSTGPATCFNALPVGLRDVQAVEICNQATSDEPAKCAQNAPAKFTSADKVTLCATSNVSAAAECAHYYTGSTTSAGGLTTGLKASLCSGALSTAPAECYYHAGMMMATTNSMSASERVELCINATDITPAICASMLHPTVTKLGSRARIEACKNQSSTTAAYCILHAFHAGRPITSRKIKACRSATSFPHTFEISRVSYDCPSLVPNCRVSVFLEVVDQFAIPVGSAFEDFNGVTSSVSILSNDPFEKRMLVGEKLAPITSDGVVHFGNLSFAEPGNFTVQFSSPDLEPIVAYLRVSESFAERSLRESCNALFGQMQCSKFQRSEGKDDLRGDSSNSLLYTIGSMWYLQCAACSSRMETAGMKVEATLQQHFVFSVHPLSYKLLTEIGIPTDSMEWYEVLEVSAEASASAIKRAYRKKSLDWHPDRWVKFPSNFQRSAELVFQLVSQACTGW